MASKKLTRADTDWATHARRAGPTQALIDFRNKARYRPDDEHLQKVIRIGEESLRSHLEGWKKLYPDKDYSEVEALLDTATGDGK